MTTRSYLAALGPTPADGSEPVCANKRRADAAEDTMLKLAEVNRRMQAELETLRRRPRALAGKPVPTPDAYGLDKQPQDRPSELRRLRAHGVAAAPDDGLPDTYGLRTA